MSPNLTAQKRSFTTSYYSSPLSLFQSDPCAVRIKLDGSKKIVILSALDADPNGLVLRKTEITANPRSPEFLNIKFSDHNEEFLLDHTRPVVLGSGEDVFEHIPSAFAITNELDSVVIETLDSRGIFVAMDIIKEPKISKLHINWAVGKSYRWLKENIDKDKLIETAQRNNNSVGDDRFLGFPEFITMALKDGGETVQAAIFPLKVDLEGRLLSEHEELTEDHFITYFGYESEIKGKRPGFSDELKHFPISRIIGPGLSYNVAIPKVIADILGKSLLYYNGTR